MPKFADIKFISIYHIEERKAEAEEYFSSVGVKVEFVKGFNGKVVFECLKLHHRYGTVGCYLSFLSAFNLARRNGYSYVCIMEDDAVFTMPNFREAMDYFMSQLPERWDSLYLGHYPFDENEVPERFSDNLFRLDNHHGHHAVLYTAAGVKKVLECTENVAINEAFDLRVAEMGKDPDKFNSFVCYPVLMNGRSCASEDHVGIFRSTTAF